MKTEYSNPVKMTTNNEGGRGQDTRAKALPGPAYGKGDLGRAAGSGGPIKKGSKSPGM